MLLLKNVFIKKTEKIDKSVFHSNLKQEGLYPVLPGSGDPA